MTEDGNDDHDCNDDHNDSGNDGEGDDGERLRCTVCSSWMHTGKHFERENGRERQLERTVWHRTVAERAYPVFQCVFVKATQSQRYPSPSAFIPRVEPTKACW
eukprot:GHVU01104444.1.p2 GENE.GHVU01104444.1~~GHVU01104444.1.p2  ORF type:complete len:103 (-),score=6.30 GHVU01104444.1:179-487(-)